MSTVWIAFQLFSLAIAAACVALTWEIGRPLRGTILLVSLAIVLAPLLIRAALTARRPTEAELRSKVQALVWGMLFVQLCNPFLAFKGIIPWWVCAPLVALSLVIQVSAIVVLRTSRNAAPAE
jgi:hypothetical protein